MFFAGFPHEPNNVFGFESGCVSNELTEMTVIGCFKLILNDNFFGGVFFLCKNINVIPSYIGFHLNEFYANPNLVAQHFQVLWFGQPFRKVTGLMCPVSTQLNLIQLGYFHAVNETDFAVS